MVDPVRHRPGDVVSSSLTIELGPETRSLLRELIHQFARWSSSPSPEARARGDGAFLPASSPTPSAKADPRPAGGEPATIVSSPKLPAGPASTNPGLAGPFDANGRPWTKDDIQTLIRMIGERRSNGEIALALMRSVSAIAKKVKILREQGTQFPIRPRGTYPRSVFTIGRGYVSPRLGREP
jgi:hypothetical protein